MNERRPIYGGGYGGGYGGFGGYPGSVWAAMAEATAATRSIIIIIGKANISDHSGKSTLGTARVFFCDRF
ncbi:hypothetical protein V7196_13140 [Bacillus velezensis]